jgi:hypothetical protein
MQIQSNAMMSTAPVFLLIALLARPLTPSYAMGRQRRRLVSRPDHIAKVEYDRKHPWAAAWDQSHRRDATLFISDYKADKPTEPIRITFYTDYVEDRLHILDKANNSTNNGSSSFLLTAEQEQENTQIKILLEQVLPKASQFWSNAIGVIPVLGNLRINIPDDKAAQDNIQTPEAKSLYSNCPLIDQHSKVGTPNTDLMIYMYARRDCSSLSEGEAVVGRNGARGGGATFGFPCELDQFDRPIGGTMDFCLDTLELNRVGVVSDHIQQKALTSVKRQIGNILGVHPTLYKFFRHTTTGLPLTPRPFVEERVECVGGGGTDVLQMPACNTLLQGQTATGIHYYQVVTPTVKTVMKNHFDCSYVQGARLENQHPSSNGGESQYCLGYEWESRWFEGELMSPMHTSSTHALSPLTLALLEDSGWYKANYTASQTLSFGHKAGCRFLHDECIADNGKVVPDYMQGFFCNVELDSREFELSTASRMCDPYHTHKAFCDLVDFNDTFFGSFNAAPGRGYSHFNGVSTSKQRMLLVQ